MSTHPSINFKIGNTVIDAGYAVDEVVKAQEEVYKAGKELEKATKDGKYSEEARVELAAKLLLAEAKVAEAAKNAVKAGVEIKNSVSTLGFYAETNIEYEESKRETNIIEIESIGSDVIGKGNVIIMSGGDIKQVGSKVESTKEDVYYLAKGNVQILASQDNKEIETETSYKSGSGGIKTTGTGYANYGESESEGKIKEEKNNISKVIAKEGEVVIQSGEKTEIIGGLVIGGAVGIEAKGGLRLESVQDSMESEGENMGWNIGFSGKANEEEKDWSIGAGYKEGSQEGNIKWVNNASGIIAGGELKINTGILENVGGLINSNSGELEINADKIINDDIKNENNYKNTGWGINGNVSKEQESKDIKGNDIGLSLILGRGEKEGITRGTIGEGELNVKDETGIQNINRDIDKMNEIMKDEVNSALDVEFSYGMYRAIEYFIGDKDELKNDLTLTGEGLNSILHFQAVSSKGRNVLYSNIQEHKKICFFEKKQNNFVKV
ncbi:MAG: hemagglutinin repeat-containing protein [Elusimicrobiota bacterium]|nr:hemagglutinin repeat-containing protein [Elusimicrobiota bacterium]